MRSLYGYLFMIKLACAALYPEKSSLPKDLPGLKGKTREERIKEICLEAEELEKQL